MLNRVLNKSFGEGSDDSASLEVFRLCSHQQLNRFLRHLNPLHAHYIRFSIIIPSKKQLPMQSLLFKIYDQYAYTNVAYPPCVPGLYFIQLGLVTVITFVRSTNDTAFPLVFSLLDAFAKLRKTTITFVISVRLSVRPHGTTRLLLAEFS